MTNRTPSGKREEMNQLRINEHYHEIWPNNCPVIEQDGDGHEVGTCCYATHDGICPRHGDWRKLTGWVDKPAQAGESEK
jgi:hypothetical protein